MNLFDSNPSSLAIQLGNTVEHTVSCLYMFHILFAEPHSSGSSVADLRTGGCWFDPGLDQYSFLGLMIVSTIIMWESSQWLGKNSVWGTG